MKVRLLALNNHPVHGDDGLVRQAAAVLASKGVRHEIARAADLGVPRTWSALASCRAVVSVRLHGAIPAYLSGVPFALYEYHRKCADFVDDVGQHSSLRLPPTSHGLAGAGEAVEALLDGPTAPAMTPRDYRNRAEAGFRAAPWAEPLQ